MSRVLAANSQNGTFKAPRRGRGTNTAQVAFCELRCDRPTYRCPKCKQVAMQFYAQLPGDPRRSDVFHCYACGASWEV